jgi:hypothetical protein
VQRIDASAPRPSTSRRAEENERRATKATSEATATPEATDHANRALQKELDKEHKRLIDLARSETTR